MNEPRATRYLVHLFPPSWRARYETEFAALLADTGVSIGVVYDVALAALDARLHPANHMKRWSPMTDTLRRLELVVFVAWVAFVVAGSAFAKLTEDPPLSLLIGSPVTSGLSRDVLILAAVASLAGILIAGVPIALAIALEAVRTRRWGQLALLATPAVAAAAWFSLTLLVSQIPFAVTDDVPRLAFLAVWVGAGLLGVTLSCLALRRAVLNANIGATLYSRAVKPAYLAVAGMIGGTIAIAAWGVVLFLSDNYDFWGFSGLLATSTALSWLAIVVTMVVATAVALRAVTRLRTTVS